MEKKVENARYITEYKGQNFEKFDRIYFGNEISDQYLPSLADIKNIVKNIKQQITLVTPFVTEFKLHQVNELLEYCNNIKKVDEVVINDLGTLNLIKNYPQLKPVAGRVLIKQKTDPRYHYEEFKNKISSLHTSLSDKSLSRLLKSYNVKRAELNNSLQGVKVPDSFSYSVYYPFVLVAIRRWAKPEKKILLHTSMKTKLYSDGHAIYYHNKIIHPSLKSKINRIVFNQI